MLMSETWRRAERILREYGEAAETECEARASYHEMQADPVMAEKWRATCEIIRRLRNGERPAK